MLDNACVYAEGYCDLGGSHDLCNILEHIIYGMFYTHTLIYEWGPPKLVLIYKELCIPTCLYFSHLQSALHLMQYTYRAVFFSIAQNSV